MQPAIDAAALELMREFNKSSGGSSRSSGEGKEKEKEKEEEKYFLAVPTVYNTTQCYLRGATEKLRGELELAAKEGFSWGGKLVRGAYIDSENKRADAAKVPSPCWSSIGETHECYDACARIAVEEGVFAWGGEVLLATVSKEEEGGGGERERERESEGKEKNEKRETNEKKKNTKISKKNENILSAQQGLREQSSRPPLEAREGAARRGRFFFSRLLRAALRDEVRV